MPVFASHSDSSTRTCRSEPCSCASCVCRGPSPPLARHFPHVSSNSTLDSQPTGQSLNPSLSQFRGLRDTPKGTSVARHCPHCSGAHYNPRAFFVRAIMMQHVSYEVHHLQRCTHKLGAHVFLRCFMLCRRRAISLKHFQ